MTESDITNALTRAKCCLADMQYKLAQKRAQGSKDADCLETKTFLLSMFIDALNDVLDCINGDPGNFPGTPCNLDLLSGGYCWDSVANNLYIIIASGDSNLIPYEDYYYEYALSLNDNGPWTTVSGFNTNYAVINVEGLELYLRIRMYCNQTDAAFREEIVEFKTFPPQFDAATFGYFTTSTDTSPSVIPAFWSVREGETVTISNRNTDFIISNIEVDNVSVVTDVQNYTFVAGTDITDGQSIEIFFQYIGDTDTIPPPCDLYRLIEISVVPDPLIVASNTVMCPNGSVDLSVSNYNYDTYLWSTGETTDTITVTEPGVYSVVTSVDGLTGLIDYQTITDDGISPQFILYNISTGAEVVSNGYICSGGSSVFTNVRVQELTGVNMTGATVSYVDSGGGIIASSLAWPAASNLSGNSSVKALVQLSNGCTYDSTLYTENTLPSTSQIITNACTCNGISDGSIVASPATFIVGSVSIVSCDYELYNASSVLINSSSGLAYFYSGLAAGNYTLDITYNWSNGTSCSGTENITIIQPSTITVTPVFTPNVCYDPSNSGTLTVTVTGGTGSVYDISFNGVEVLSGVTSPAVYTVAPLISNGTYSVEARDVNGCVGTNSVLITNAVAINTSYTVGTNSITVTGVSGGSGTYIACELYDINLSFIAEFDLGALPDTKTGLSSGEDYIILTTDDQGCTQIINPITIP